MATTIIAGKTQVTGELKDYEFSSDEAFFRFFINKNVDTGALVNIQLPVPNAAMVEAIKNAGLKGLVNATIDFNHNRIKMSGGVMSNRIRRDPEAPIRSAMMG